MKPRKSLSENDHDAPTDDNTATNDEQNRVSKKEFRGDLWGDPAWFNGLRFPIDEEDKPE